MNASALAPRTSSAWVTVTPPAVRRKCYPATSTGGWRRRRKRGMDPNGALRLKLTSSLVMETAEAEGPAVLPRKGEEEEEEIGSRSESGASASTRRLILVRHAESSWSQSSIRDHDRPVSEAGKSDAIKLSHKLQQSGWIPQLILLSDALRSKETLRIMQEQVQSFLEAEVHFISSFYSIAAMDGQTAEHLQQAILKYSRDEIFTIMCMGHNRGWEEAASMFSGASVELKTCNAALLEATGRSWEEAITLAGLGGWKLHAILKPNS
ncbi:hypothetical protein MLD38_039189 [Melastoma candidum]|uniref:Uncharacterized protein n=1 Tax=Melastoma candidum TaxID=119954 RepID=A0ACB9L241_9MYRT|nr:hypothetical protein MLD38_039189 [Melastoma candidum]